MVPILRAFPPAALVTVDGGGYPMYASSSFAFVAPLHPVLDRPTPEAFVENDEDTADDPLRTYLREIHEVDLLTAADERELACRIEERVALYRMQAELTASLCREPT